MWFIDSTGKLRRALVDIDGHIQIDVLSTPLSALIGEVQASPTTYTVLDRLKTLATLLNAGLPAALDTGALKVREQSPLTEIGVNVTKVLGSALSHTNPIIIRISDGVSAYIDPTQIRLLTAKDIVTIDNFPSDYPDAAVAKLLAGGLPSALTSDKLKVRASEIETLLAGGLPSTLDTGALRVKEQSPITSISASLTEPVVTGARGKTTIIKAGGANNSTNNFYTVTAGKTFYLVGGAVTANINAAALNGIWYVQADTGGDGVFRTLMYGNFFTSAAGGADRAHVTCPLTLAVPLPFTAGTVFRCVSNAVAVEVYPTVWGWEE